MTRRRDIFGLAFFALFWLLPITYHGFSGSRKMPLLPYPLLHLTNVSCLFTHAFRTWPVDFVQVQHVEGGEWETLQNDRYFSMRPFGYHTRMGELLNRRLGMASVQELAAWFRHRYAELHPQGKAPRAVRFVSCLYTVGGRIPSGAWQDPPLESFPPEERRVWFTLVFAPPPSRAPAPGPDAARP